MTEWYDLGWHDASAALEARLTANLLRFDQIAELHAVHRLGARFPDMSSRVPTPGHDVLFEGRRVEVKAKEPSAKPRSRLYVEPQPGKRKGSDLFWFYMFGESEAALEVWEVDTPSVFANLSLRRGKAITLARIERIGRPIWRDGRDCRKG